MEDEGWRVRKDGTRFWANVVITPLRDTDGKLRGYGKITRDLTERRAAELALRESEERFRCTFEDARIGMAVVDLEGRFERVNRAFCAIVGYTQEELTGRSRASITHPEDVAQDASAMRALLDGDVVSYASEKRFMHAAGHDVWVEVNVALVRGIDGAPLRCIVQVYDITERRQYESRLKHMADHDPLTGLLNRRAFERELHGHAARSSRYGSIGVVLFLDLDNFKHYNDTLGHAAGDNLLANVASGLRSRMRDTDVLARMGGDEFAVLLPFAEDAAAETVAETLLEIVREIPRPRRIHEAHRITASIGIARFDAGEAPRPDDVMLHADLAMYDAKASGRDRWSRYRPELLVAEQAARFARESA